MDGRDQKAEHEEAALRMALRRGLARAFNDPHDCNGTRAWRWLGRVLGKDRAVVAPVHLTRDELVLASAKLEQLVAGRAAPGAEARAA